MKVKIFVGDQIKRHIFINAHSKTTVVSKWLIRKRSRVDERSFQVKTDELSPVLSRS
jgi:hypothetical protein